MDIFASLFMSSFSLVFLSDFSYAADSITQSQSLSDSMTMVSKDGSFVLGFFTPGMKLGWDLRTGLDRCLSAWKNWDDPSPGDFTWGIELHDNPEAVMWKGSKKYYRNSPWNGLEVFGAPELKPNQNFGFNFVFNENEVYYQYYHKDKSIISRMFMDQTDYSRSRYIWIEANSTWSVNASVPRDSCDSYNFCGAYGLCVISESPVCQCLKGFQPKSQETWNPIFWTQGCLCKTQLRCQDKHNDGFVTFDGLKLPDY
uniref:EGF-like domain-containing protein n=1 Tax=Fagus sylvatica TaxID=28930 RepID=A0A2N9FN74_FAGSY